jgi:hypothetical protein
MKSLSSRNVRRARGVLAMEAILALAAALALLMMLTYTVAQQHKAQRRLAATRATARRVEAALLAIQAQGPPGAPLPTGLQVARLEAEPGGPAAPAGHLWVRVTAPASDDAPAYSLVGLVAADHVPSLPAGGLR